MMLSHKLIALRLNVGGISVWQISRPISHDIQSVESILDALPPKPAYTDEAAYRQWVNSAFNQLWQAGPFRHWTLPGPFTNQKDLATVARFNADLAILVAVQVGQFGSTLATLGTHAWHHHLLTQFKTGHAQGGIALEEAADGMIQTTATYNELDNTFTINTPTPDAQKRVVGWCSTLTHLIVFAQVLVARSGPVTRDEFSRLSGPHPRQWLWDELIRIGCMDTTGNVLADAVDRLNMHRGLAMYIDDLTSLFMHQQTGIRAFALPIDKSVRCQEIHTHPQLGIATGYIQFENTVVKPHLLLDSSFESMLTRMSDARRMIPFIAVHSLSQLATTVIQHPQYPVSHAMVLLSKLASLSIAASKLMASDIDRPDVISSSLKAFITEETASSLTHHILRQCHFLIDSASCSGLWADIEKQVADQAFYRQFEGDNTSLLLFAGQAYMHHAKQQADTVADYRQKLAYRMDDSSRSFSATSDGIIIESVNGSRQKWIRSIDVFQRKIESALGQLLESTSTEPLDYTHPLSPYLITLAQHYAMRQIALWVSQEPSSAPAKLAEKLTVISWLNHDIQNAEGVTQTLTQQLATHLGQYPSMSDFSAMLLQAPSNPPSGLRSYPPPRQHGHYVTPTLRVTPVISYRSSG